MKPLKCGSESGRIQSFAPPAGSRAIHMAADVVLRWGREHVRAAPYFTVRGILRCVMAKTGLGLTIGLLVLLAGLPWSAAGQRPAGVVVSWGGQMLPWVSSSTRFKAIAAGSAHTLAVEMDGTVVAWGDNSRGQAAVPAGLNGVIAVAASGGHSLALKRNGTVVAWGISGYGQNAVPAGLGNVTAIADGAGYCLALKYDDTVVAWGQSFDGRYWNAISVPANLNHVAAISAGGDYWLALKKDGTVCAYGYSSAGATNVPAGLSNVVGIAAGPYHSLALRQDGTVVAWGWNAYGQTAVPTTLHNVTAIAAGIYHSLALKSDGTVVAWGAIGRRELGDPFYGQSIVPAGLKGVTAIAAGDCHSVAIKQDGTVAAWGAGGPGQFTAADRGQSTVPGYLSGIVAIDSGARQSLALEQDGTILAWGEPFYGEANVPTNLTDVIAVSGGYGHSLALRQDGTVVAWGGDAYALSVVPSGLSNVVAIAAGKGYYSLALKQDGTVVAWGWWANGYSPVYVPKGLTDVTAIAAGYAHCLALKRDGTVVAWGSNTVGQINVPANLGQVTAIAAGVFHSLALRSDGTVVAWGDNTDGQSTVPAGLTGVISIAAGPDNSMAIKGNGTVVAWGNNYLGVSAVPRGLVGAMMISSGDYTSLALIGLPIIESQPVGQIVARDTPVEFQVQATGPGPLTYQWFFNATNLISEATNAILDRSDAQLSQSGPYTVVVSNHFGTATSLPAVLTVAAAPVIVSSPTSQDAFVDDTINFSAMMEGVLPMAYQWYFDGHAIAQATNASLQLPDIQPWQTGNYSVVISNIYGAATSAPAVLNVYSPVTLTDCSETALRAALQLTKNVVLNCDGTIDLSDSILIESKTVLAAASGRQVTISGNHIARVFYVGADGDLILSNLVIANGLGDYGSGNYGADVCGAGVYNEGLVTVINCTFTNNLVGGQNGFNASYSGVAGYPGGNGVGGAIWNSGVLRASACTFVGNTAIGGVGGSGSVGEPFPYPPENQGFPGGPGGNGIGGAVFNSGTAYFVNCTFAFNTSQGGAGGPGGPGYWYSPDYPPGAQGPPGEQGNSMGAIYDAPGECYLTNCTIAFNSGVGIWTTSANGANLVNTLLSKNSPMNNGLGAISDLGHNLSSDSSCAFTTDGSMNNTDSDLGPLTDNGGPTWSMALLPGSPAIDAGSAADAPGIDQRGIARPQGMGVDIGAFEYIFRPLFTGVTIQATTNRQMLLRGLTPNPTITLQASTNLLNWWNVTNFTTGSNGLFEILDPLPDHSQLRFYRLKTDAP